MSARCRGQGPLPKAGLVWSCQAVFCKADQVLSMMLSRKAIVSHYMAQEHNTSLSETADAPSQECQVLLQTVQPNIMSFCPSCAHLQITADRQPERAFHQSSSIRECFAMSHAANPVFFR